MPVNPDPDTERGNVYVGVVGGEDVGIVLGGEELIQARVRGDDLSLSHFVTCPKAEEHRRRNVEVES